MLLRLAARRGDVGHTLKINSCLLLALRPTLGKGCRQLSTTPPEGGTETPAKPVKKFPMKLGGNMKIKVKTHCDDNTTIIDMDYRYSKQMTNTKPTRLVQSRGLHHQFR
jgi:hypothetical protein